MIDVAIYEVLPLHTRLKAMAFPTPTVEWVNVRSYQVSALGNHSDAGSVCYEEFMSCHIQLSVKTGSVTTIGAVRTGAELEDVSIDNSG